CVALASALGNALGTTSWCGLDNKVKLRSATLFKGLWDSRGKNASRTTTYVAPAGGTFVVTATTLGDTKVALDTKTIIDTRGLAEFSVPRTDQVTLRKGTRYRFTLTWQGAPPSVTITDAQPEVAAAVHAASGAKVAVVLAYDLAREGMDRSTLQLPGAQSAVISAIAQHMPTVVLLATDGAVSMPWLAKAGAVLEGWDPTGAVNTDRTLSQYAGAWRNLLDGTADPSGRLPETFPASTTDSPLGNASFWPGIGTNVDLNLPPDHGIGIGMPWYRSAGWPVLFPFGYGLSYADFSLQGGSVANVGGALQVSVTVQDSNGLPGVEVVQLYADFPSSLGEPRQQLVAFGTVRFTKTSLATSSTKTATLTVTPDALTVYEGATMRVEKGSYCLQASTYAGDPKSWTTGPDALGATPNGQVITGGAATLSPGSCPS
ncbi:MAG TPA: glycoside hydrolase family 3 C-terminal domain-containing protein, partial [Acidimicrobiales bacterium]|nr:glycoside hydrolase family 3 C-terminal domain-containing protein [Acidimicrobiales bacterium]